MSSSANLEKYNKLVSKVEEKTSRLGYNSVIDAYNEANEALERQREFETRELQIRNAKTLYDLSTNKKASPVDNLMKAFEVAKNTNQMDIINQKYKAKQELIEQAKSTTIANSMAGMYNTNNQTPYGAFGEGPSADYTLWGATKSAATRGTAELLQGSAKALQSAGNEVNKAIDLGILAMTDEDSADYYDKKQAIENKWDTNDIGVLSAANVLARPLNEAANRINHVNLYNNTDVISRGFRDGLYEGIAALSNTIAETLITSAPEIVPVILNPYLGVAAGASAFIARADKERQAKALGKKPDEILNVSPNMTAEDIIGGAIYGGLNLADASILKNAFGRGQISRLSDGVIGLTEKASEVTKKAFDNLQKIDWLKPVGNGAKAVAWTADKAYKTGKFGAKVGGKVGIAYGIEGAAEMGQTLMEQWANGDLKDRSILENWEDIKEAGLLGGIVGGSIKAPHAVYQEGTKILKAKKEKEEKANEFKRYTEIADITTQGAKNEFSKLEEEKFGENFSNEDLQFYKDNFEGMTNGENISSEQLNQVLENKEILDESIKTLYLAKSGKLGIEATKKVAQAYDTIVNEVLNNTNPNNDILASKTNLEKLMYAINLRNDTFIEQVFKTAGKNTDGQILHSPEGDLKDTVNTYLKALEVLRDTLTKGIEDTRNLLGDKISEAKDRATIAKMNRIVNEVKYGKTSDVNQSVVFNGYNYTNKKTGQTSHKKSVFDYMNILKSGKLDTSTKIANASEDLSKFVKAHYAKLLLHRNINKKINNNELNRGDIIVIPRFATSEDEVLRFKSEKDFKNYIWNMNNRNNGNTIEENHFHKYIYNKNNEELLNNLENEYEMMEGVEQDYRNEYNRLKNKENTEKENNKNSNTTTQNTKSNENSKKEPTQEQSNEKPIETNDKKEPTQDNSKKDATQEKTDEVKSKNNEDTINIYSTSNNKFSYLTNVTNSPLVLNIGGQKYHFTSVEHAYQSLKHNDFSKSINEWTLAEVYKKNWSNVKKIRSELRENRENDSNIKIMEYLISERAKQDPKFIPLLKETGNTTLTHNEDTTIWRNEFPRILMDLRSGKEMSKPQTTQNITPQSQNIQSNQNKISFEEANGLDEKGNPIDDDTLPFNSDSKSNQNNANIDSNTDQNTQDNNKQEDTTSLDNEQKVSQEITNENKKENIINNLKAWTTEISKETLQSMHKALMSITKNGKNIGKELFKRVQMYGIALSKFVQEDKKSESRIANIDDITEIANRINQDFSGIRNGFFNQFFNTVIGKDGLLASIKANYNSTNSITTLFKLNSYTSIKIKRPNGKEAFAEISTQPGAILLHDNRTILSMAIRGLETLTSLQFNASKYRNMEEMTENLQKVFGKDLDVNLDYKTLKVLNEYSLENSYLLDIGRNIIKDLGIEFIEDKISKEQESFIAQELGAYTIDILESMGFIQRTALRNSQVFSNSKIPTGQLNLIKIADNIFSKNSQDENSTKNILEKLNALCEELKIDRNQERVAYRFGRGFGKLKDGIGRTTKGKLKHLYEKSREAINISRNTKFVMKSRGYLIEFFKDNGITLNTLNKASEGYTVDLEQKLDKIKDPMQTHNLDEKDIILFSEIESKKGKNLGIENENEYMWNMLHNDEVEKGVWFDFRFSKNEREFLQSDGINPQAHKISRFLLVPQALFAKYTKGANGEIMYKGKEDTIAYQHIAQSFGMGTDKTASDKSIAFGKSIVALANKDFNKLEKAIATAMKNGQIEFEVDGIELSIAELGHSLSALAALGAYSKANTNEKFEAAILGEADGINNGIAIKLLQYMLSPKYVELLQSTGIDFYNQASDAISDYFDKGSSKKILDLYQKVAKQFNDTINSAANDLKTTRENTLAVLSNDVKGVEKLDQQAISSMSDNITLSLKDIYTLDDKDNVTKSARNATKPIVQVFGYGAGDESQINGLISSLMGTIERKALDFINGDKSKEFYYNILHATYYLVTGNKATPQDIKNVLIHGIEVLNKDKEKYTTTLLNARINGTNITGYKIVKGILKAQLENTIKETMANTFPGIREQSQLINEITNNRIKLVQKYFEHKKAQILKETGKDYLTISELKKLQKELQKKLPGITLSIASKEELDNLEAKHYFENTKEKTSESAPNSQIFFGRTEGKKSLTLNPKETVYLDNGAGTNVIAIHQKDGSTILLTVVNTAKELNNGEKVRTFLGIHDATVTGSHNALQIQQEMNKNALEMDMATRQLNEFAEIAKSNIELYKEIITNFENGDLEVDLEFEKELEIQSKLQEAFAKISNINRSILSNYAVSYNNIQNGNKGSAYKYTPEKGLLDNKVEGQSFNDLLIDFSNISSRHDDNLINMNLPELIEMSKQALSTLKYLNKKNNLSEKDVNKLASARETLSSLTGKEGLLNQYLKKLDMVIDEHLDKLGTQTTKENTLSKKDTKDNNIQEISFNTKYENIINAITKAINKNNIEGIKEAYEAVNDNERGFRQAINKYLNSLDNMSESYKTSFKNKIKEALGIDIDKKLTKNEKAREEIEENITDENLKEALNKEIDNSENILYSPENIEINDGYFESNAIPLLDDIQNNPNAISEIQDNLRDLDKQNGRATDEEHSKHLKEILSKITGVLSQSVGDLKVLFSETNAKDNTGNYNDRINTITIKSSSNPNFTGYMGNELTYAHELSHASTHFAVRFNGGNNKFTHMLHRAYNLFLANASADTIAENLDFIESPRERTRIANMLYKYMTTNKDPLTNLEEFLAIGLTDKAMIKILKSIPYKDNTENKSLFQKIKNGFFEILDTIFGDNILKVKKDKSTYDMLVSLAVQMGKSNQNAKNMVNQNKSEIREIVGFALEKANSKLSNTLKTVLSPIKKTLLKEIINSDSNSVLSSIKSCAAASVLSMCSKTYSDDIKKELTNMNIAMNNDTVYGAIIEDLSTPSDMARRAQRFQRESSRIDAKRKTMDILTSETLKKLFSHNVSDFEAKSMGEIMLDADITSLDMGIEELADLLSNEELLDKQLKNMKSQIEKAFKLNEYYYNKKIKTFMYNRATALAFKMVTGKNIDNNVLMNAHNIVNFVNPKNKRTQVNVIQNGKKINVNDKLENLFDKYITLQALKLSDKGMKNSVAQVMKMDKEASEKILTFIKNFKEDTANDLFQKNKFGNNKHQIIKGYRRDVYDSGKEIIWGDINKEQELAKQGYKKITTSLDKNINDSTKETRCMYVNTFITHQTTFTRQAMRYTQGMSRGHELRDLFNKEIYENPDKVLELEKAYQQSMREARENMLTDHKAAMNTELPLDFKTLSKMSKNSNLQPILDEYGEVASFSYQMSKDVKRDVLGLNTDIFKSLGKMKSSYYDKVATKNLNNDIVALLIKDYEIVAKNPKELDIMFMELSHNTKDPLKREVYKMLDYETRTKLEKAMGGKIMVRKDTFQNIFGVRDVDIRNNKWFKNMSNTEVKKAILFTAELVKTITKLFKIETVIKTPGVWIGNQVSNIFNCMNYGISLNESIKLHREAVVNLRRYQEDKRKLIELELRVKAGEKINPDNIRSLRISLINNPVYPLIKAGFLNTIVEDLDNDPKGYFEEKYTEMYNKQNKVVKGAIDWAFLTEKTFIGKGLTEYVHISDFISRYTLYYGLKGQGKLNEDQIIDEISDAFIDYDMITNRWIKFANDYGLALFTRFLTRSQKLLKNHIIDRPFTTAAILATQAHAGDLLGNSFGSSIYDTVFWNKNYSYMMGLANPFYNAIDVLTPSGMKLIPGLDTILDTKSLRDSSIIF
jgi:hypothetical protein